MSDLASVQTTSFYTRLSFMDEDNDDALLGDEDENDDCDYGQYNVGGNSGTELVVTCLLRLEQGLPNYDDHLGPTVQTAKTVYVKHKSSGPKLACLGFKFGHFTEF